VQQTPQDPVTWQVIRLQGSDPLAVRASKKLIDNDLLCLQLGGTVLRMKLDGVPLWRGDHVEVRQLIEDFARYVYLPRLKDPSVLIRAVQSGLSLPTWEKDGFAYAESFDEQARRYRGLRVGQAVGLSESAPAGLVVKPEVARRQLDAEREETHPTGDEQSLTYGTDRVAGVVRDMPVAAPPKPVPKRFYAAKELDATKSGLEASEIAREVIAHLVGVPGAEVRVTLEIQATFREEVPDHVIQTIRENCRTLRLSYDFEEE